MRTLKKIVLSLAFVSGVVLLLLALAHSGSNRSLPHIQQSQPSSNGFQELTGNCGGPFDEYDVVVSSAGLEVIERSTVQDTQPATDGLHKIANLVVRLKGRLIQSVACQN